MNPTLPKFYQPHAISLILNEQKPVLDISTRIKNFSADKQRTLAKYLKNTLSSHLENFVDDEIPYSTFPEFSVQKILRIDRPDLLTTSKQHFLGIIKIHFRREVEEYFLEDNVSKILDENCCLTCSLKGLINVYESLLSVYKVIPKRYPEIEKVSGPTLESLHDLFHGNLDYKFGLKLDIDETKKQEQLVFVIFEKNGHNGDSRILVPESDL